MPDYRLYFLGRDGHIQQAADIEAASDEAALEVAQQMADGRPMELWQRAFRLAVIPGWSEAEKSEPTGALAAPTRSH
ncbi:hypothetical protein LRS10_22055 [Phenylobacterium sp. J426]|uniref:hypothetical protein n=1 Tax=Phenylobacterium sp. J426 TaxID=2898439 RepID=UPI0021511767|nr:hypothetical protein [Phenylobacterium sp. J426]MCR5876595.1 hypothetical protein [Phenylobacterium sp. J426]